MPIVPASWKVGAKINQGDSLFLPAPLFLPSAILLREL